MRWPALPLAVVLALTLARSAAAEETDPWCGPDKAKHFGASLVLAAGGYAVGTALFEGHAAPAALGGGVALGAGIGKEALDAAGYGQPSWRDLTWDVAGTAVGLGLALVVHLALEPEERPGEHPTVTAVGLLAPGSGFGFAF
jgi:uncharacterized protein YfiM (DUF2279 family)